MAKQLLFIIISFGFNIHLTNSLIQVFRSGESDTGTPLYKLEDEYEISLGGVDGDNYNKWVGHLIYFDEPAEGCTTPPKAPPISSDGQKWFLLSRYNRNTIRWFTDCDEKMRVDLATKAGYSALLLQDVRPFGSESLFKSDIYSAFITDRDGILLRQKFTPSTYTYVVIIEHFEPFNFFTFIFKLIGYAILGVLGLFVAVAICVCFLPFCEKYCCECCCEGSTHGNSSNEEQNERSRLLESNAISQGIINEILEGLQEEQQRLEQV